MALTNLHETISEMGANAFHMGKRIQECPFRYGGHWARVWKDSYIAERDGADSRDRVDSRTTTVRIIRRKEQSSC